MKCKICKKEFNNQEDLRKHNEMNKNCNYRCSICLKYFSNKRNLNRHGSIVCKQKFQCDTCNNIYTSRYRLKEHQCASIKQDVTENTNITEMLKNIPNNIPSDKQVNIINISNNNNNNEIKHEINNEINSNNKIMNNFLTTTPVNFANFEYKVRKDLGGLIPKLLKMDDYTEELADQYMYEEKKFKQIQNEDIIRKYDKDPLQVEGLKRFFTELQKDVENRNVIIKKSKSGKCYVYGTEWKEKQLKETTQKICNKVCDTLFDIETSMNHFVRLILGSQPKRYTELKKHIHKEIIKAGKIVNEELIK